ncbi:Dynein Heavy Chain 2, Axonemal [Manis pentadactyla]|nr:Dynein Heavy Chain 2, Axonemal [Manis pentadactyla]
MCPKEHPKHPAPCVHKNACLKESPAWVAKPHRGRRKNEEEQDKVEVLEPVLKKIRVEEFALAEEAPKICSPLCAQEGLFESKSSVESKAPQKKGQAGSVGEPPAQEEGSRVKKPEGLVGLDSGFSSQDFYNVFSCLRRKNEEEEDKVAVLESASK